MTKHKSIVILITYFGPFPWYFRYFLHSCKFNPNVDFVMVTDNELPNDLPKNVEFVNTTLQNLISRASKTMGFNVAINEPYKLCDFKPAYGFLFPELIKKYSFWGYTDIDVIFGNIRNFITHKILSEYDVISVHDDYLSGIFTLFRNCDKMNRLFEQSKDYKKVFSESRNFYFDETNFAFGEFSKHLPPAEIITEIESMTHVVQKKHQERYLNAYFNSHILEGLPGRLKWQDGRLIYKNEIEAMCFNLILLKKIYHPKRAPKKITNCFYISQSRIYSK